MSKYTLLTGPAAEAIDWVMVRLPDAAFDSFRAEAEAALADICARHGVTPDVMEGFKVKRFIADREPITPAVFGTQYDFYGDVFLLPDDPQARPLKLHDDGYWYPAAEHLTRSVIASAGGGKSPARATKLGDPAKGEKTPRTYFVKGTHYACDAGQFVECGGQWYSLLTDLKWHRMKDGMPARYKQQLREIEKCCKIEVFNEFYKGE